MKAGMLKLSHLFRLLTFRSASYTDLVSAKLPKKTCSIAINYCNLRFIGSI